MYFTIGLLVGLIAGAIALYGFFSASGRNIIAQAKTDAEGIRNAAKTEAENKAREIELKAKGEQLKAREMFDKETANSRKELKDLDIRLTKREDILDKKLDTLTT